MHDAAHDSLSGRRPGARTGVLPLAALLLAGCGTTQFEAEAVIPPPLNRLWSAPSK